MGLITSAAEAQAIQGRNAGTGDRLSVSGGGFSSVLKNQFANISEDMDAIFEEAAARYSLPANLIKSVAKAESGFNPGAVSHAGAMGVMQLMPGTARSLGVSDPFDARQSIMGGARYLKENLDSFGDVSLALAAYNAGPNAVRKYDGIPPYKETQNYVQKVMSYMGGAPIYANRSVSTGGGRGDYGGGDYSSVMAAMNLGGLGGLSSGGLGSMSSLSGLSSSGLGSLSGIAGSGYGLDSSSLEGLSVSQDGNTVTMDKESFAGLIQILRVQMMMNADREVGMMNT